MCTACHRGKTDAGKVPASDEHIRFVAELMYGRIYPEVAVLLCDDDAWNSVRRELKSARRQRLLDQLADQGYERSNFPGLTWAQIWHEVLLDDPIGEDEPGEAGDGPDSYFARAMGRDD